MASSWASSWGTSWGTSWGGGGAPPVVTPTKDSGAGAGRRKWKVIPLDEWLALHHPEESVEKQTGVIEALGETIDEAPPEVAREVNRQLNLETQRVERLLAELKGQSQKVAGLADFLGELLDYKDALDTAKRNALKAQRALRELDDEEALMTIIYHA